MWPSSPTCWRRERNSTFTPLADDEAYAIADQCRDLERRINETAPQTAIGAAVKLRQVLWIADSKWDALADDEITSLRQLLAFVEATP